MLLTVVRHGETVENKNHIIQGQSPGTLTAKGINQAKKLAKDLMNDNFDIVYCSDLKRCVDTADEIMTYHQKTPIVYTSKIREINLPGCEGNPWNTEKWDHPDDRLNRRVVGGESFADMWIRIEAFTNEVLLKHPNQNVLVVAHGGPIRGFLTLLRDATVEQTINPNYSIENCGIWRWEISKPFSLPDL